MAAPGGESYSYATLRLGSWLADQGDENSRASAAGWLVAAIKRVGSDGWT